MSHKLSRRQFLSGTMVAAAATALGACAPAPTPTPTGPVSEATVAPTEPISESTTAPLQPAEEPTKAEPTKEIVELVVTRGEHPSQPILQDAPAHIAQGKAVGVKLIMQPVPSTDYDDKLGVWMATGQVPDIARVGFYQIREYAKPAVFQPIRELAEAHGPNVVRYLESHADSVAKLYMGGDLYLVPTERYNYKLLAPMPCIRKDFLEELDLPFPEDFDELYETLAEIKRARPDCLGWTHRNGIPRLLMIVAYPFGSGYGGWMRGTGVPYWEPTESKWRYGPLYPEFKDVLEYLAKLYREGLLDPDIATTTADLWHERNSTDRAAFSWDNFSFCVRWNIALREVNPDASWAPFPIIEGKRGARQNDYSGFAGTGGGWCISANCKHPARAMELFDWKLTPIGLDTCSWGIEDVHYTLNGTRPDVIDDYSTENLEKLMPSGTRVLRPEVWEEYSKKADPFRSFQSDTGTGQLDFGILWDNDVIYSWDEPGEMDAWYEMSANDPGLHPEVMVPPFTADEAERLVTLQTEVATIIDQAIEQVVLGQQAVNDFDKAVQDAIKVGAQELEDIYNEAEARA